MVNVTASEVRNISGAPTSLIDNIKIDNLISLVNEKTLSEFDIKETPTSTMEFLRIYDLNDIKVKKLKLLTLKALEIDGSSRDINRLTFDEDLGKIQPRREYDRTWVSLFPKDEPYQVKVKYDYAFLKPNGTTTESTSDVSSGSNVTIPVEDKTDFTTGEYVRIQGFDGNKEVAKITSTSSNQIVVDKLVYDHEGGSVIEELSLPDVVRQYVLYESAIAVAINAIGSTYTFNTSYSIGALSTNKGVPYTHWDASFKANQKFRDELRDRIYAMFSTIL